MIQRVFFIIQFTPIGKGIVGIKQDIVQRTGYREYARQANRPQGFQPILIATKADKIKRSQLQKQLKILRTGLGVGTEVMMIPFSAETKQGREDIWNLIDKMAAGEDLLTAEEEIQAEKAAEWAAKKAAKEAQQNL